MFCSENTHQDPQQRRTAGCVFRKADVVQRFAEDGPVVVLVDELDEDAGEAHMVGHGLVGIELRNKGEHVGSHFYTILFYVKMLLS